MSVVHPPRIYIYIRVLSVESALSKSSLNLLICSCLFSLSPGKSSFDDLCYWQYWPQSNDVINQRIIFSSWGLFEFSCVFFLMFVIISVIIVRAVRSDNGDEMFFCLLIIIIFIFCFWPFTDAAVYSRQSESIREDLPVLQRLCQTAIFQNPLTNPLIFF